MQKYGNSDSGFMPDHARRMQQRARNVALKRKEEYLGARVPKGLKDRVLNQAKEQGIPVSLLIRRVLEEVFIEKNGVLSKDESDGSRVLDKNVEDQELSSPFQEVIGWKSIELNRNSTCRQCKHPMQSGKEAHIAITPSPDQLLIVCGSCKKSLQA